MTAQIIIVVSLGIAFIAIMIVIAIKFPSPTEFQYLVFRAVLSLAAAGVGSIIPGLIDLKLQGNNLLLQAGGAVAFFVLVFLVNPAKLAITKSPASTCTLDDESKTRPVTGLRPDPQQPSVTVNSTRQKQIPSSREFNNISFEDWLRAFVRRAGSNARHKFSGISFRDATLLHGATLQGYCPITPLYEGPLTEFPQIQPSDNQRWQAARSELSKSPGQPGQAMLTSFRPPNPDAPGTVLHYCSIYPYDWNAFRNIFTDELRERYIENAYRVLNYRSDNKLKIHPQCLSTGIVVIAGDQENPFVVLGHRRGSDRKRFTSSDVWGVSMAVEYDPDRNKEASEIPETIQDFTRRSLHRKLLANYSGDFPFRFLGLAMNDLLFYYFIAVADLRPMPFEELTSLWKSSPNKSDHTALAAVKFHKNMLLDCLRDADSKTPVKSALGENPLISFESSSPSLPDTSWGWQKGSFLRLAVAQWYLENT